MRGSVRRALPSDTRAMSPRHTSQSPGRAVFEKGVASIELFESECAPGALVVDQRVASSPRRLAVCSGS